MRTSGASSASRPCSRRTPNIWIPYTPEASRPVSSRLHSCERSAIASASSSRPSHSAIAEPECSATWRWNGCAVVSAISRTATTSRRAESMANSARNEDTRQFIASVRSSTSPTA